MAVGDKFRVTLVGSLHAQTINTVLYYREATHVMGTPAIGLAAIVDSSVAANLLTWQSQEYTYLHTIAQKFDPPPSELPAVANTATGIGGGGAQSLPTAIAATITK